jgi:hypothetical protein
MNSEPIFVLRIYVLTVPKNSLNSRYFHVLVCKQDARD